MSFETFIKEWEQDESDFDAFIREWGQEEIPTETVDTNEAEKRAKDTLEIARDYEMPVNLVEDYYDEAIIEKDWFNKTIPDPSSTDVIPQQKKEDNRIGLLEQIGRMDGVDWYKRAPFSFGGFVESYAIYDSAMRLSKEKYETVSERKKKIAQAREYTQYAEPFYPEEKRLQKGLSVWEEGLSDDELSDFGQAMRIRDIELVEKYLTEQAELMERKQTFGAKVFEGASYLPAWMIEFLLTGGTQKIGSEGAKKGVEKILGNYAKTKGGQVALKTAGWAGGGITRASLGMSHRVLEETMKRRIPKQMHFGEDDEFVIDLPGDNWATAITMGWASVVIETASEEAGAAISGGLARAFSKLPFSNRLINSIQNSWMRLTPDNTTTKFINQFFTKAGYSNIIGEIGEERLATILHSIAGTEHFGTGEDADVFERLAAGLTDDIKNLPVEVAVLSLPAGMRYTARKVLSPNAKLQAQSEVDAANTQKATEKYLGTEKADLDVREPTDEEIGFAKNILHNLGIREKSGDEPISEKDYRDIFKFLQMPDDVRRSFPQFDPVYQVQRSREFAKIVFDSEFAELTKGYFELSKKDKKVVDKALFEADRNPGITYGSKALKKLGLNDKQIKAFLATRTSLDKAGNMLIERMGDAGVKEETLNEFRGFLKNYIPHKWYGNWAVAVKDKSNKTVFMSSTNYKDRFTEKSRLEKLYPDDAVKVIKRTKIPYEAFQEAPPFAVQRMIELAMEKAEVDPTTKAAMGEALTDLYKSKGFGLHFIKRKNIPGYTEDLTRPLAEYFSGFTGFITKMEAIKEFPKAVQDIDPTKTPNLYRYTKEYIKYVTGYPSEFANAKRGMYFYYLYGNIKSASLNLTQNLTLGWPILSKHTNLALPKLMQAMARTAVPKLLTKGEKAFISELEKGGHLQAKLAMEIGHQTGNPLLQPIKSQAQKAISIADVFKMMEVFNRKSMAVALYDSGIRDIKKAVELIEEAHFHYGKGNRPVLARGYISPVMVFRSWNINYITWLKNEIKAKRVGALTRSITALVLLGGTSALPFWRQTKWLWRKLFDTDPEVEARGLLGSYVGQLLTKGLPSLLDISFTGSIGMGDILPTDLKSLGGVFADIPGRISRVHKDLQVKDYGRAIEDAAPEFLRNPMSAYRMYKKGVRTRGGRPIVEFETGKPVKITAPEAIKKALGYYPLKLSEQRDIQEAIEYKTNERMQLKQNWTDRYWLAYLNKDKDAMVEVIQEVVAYNGKLKRRGRESDIITTGELNSMLQIRARPVNIPPKYMFPAMKEILEKYYSE